MTKAMHSKIEVDVVVIREGLRETGSTGTAYWDEERQQWWVVLYREEPPWRGWYNREELAGLPGPEPDR